MLAFPILKELDLPSDPSSELNILESNLHILKCGAAVSQAKWGEFLQHLCWPEEIPVPEGMFLFDVTTSRHYKLAMRAIEQLYPY